jgi:hypothetical protein
MKNAPTKMNKMGSPNPTNASRTGTAPEAESRAGMTRLVTGSGTTSVIQAITAIENTTATACARGSSGSGSNETTIAVSGITSSGHLGRDALRASTVTEACYHERRKNGHIGVSPRTRSTPS